MNEPTIPAAAASSDPPRDECEIALEPREVTRLLERWSSGEVEAADELAALTYQELRAVAGRLMSSERSGHTLQPTALVHEVWLRLAGQRSGFSNRAHFFALAARSMRRVLLDHARRKAAAKRPDPANRVDLDANELALGGPSIELLDLERALERLSELDERQGRIVELRCFAGLTVAEVAEVLEVSERTVAREWRMARAFLASRLG